MGCHLLEPRLIATQPGKLAQHFLARLRPALDDPHILSVAFLPGVLEADAVGIEEIHRPGVGSDVDRTDDRYLIVQQPLVEDIELGPTRGEGTMLHRCRRVSISGRGRASGQLKKGHHGVTTSIKKIVTQVLVGGVTAVASAHPNPWRNPQRVNQRHTQNSRVKVDGQFHILGVQREVVDAPARGYGPVRSPQRLGRCARGGLACHGSSPKRCVGALGLTCQPG